MDEPTLTQAPAASPWASERERATSWLQVKLFEGTAGLDPFDSSVLIVEVPAPGRGHLIDEVGVIVGEHPHVRPDLSTCIRVRAIVEDDIRLALGLEGPYAPVLRDVPLGSRRVDQDEARASIVEMDKSRKAGRSYS